jgi:glycosyltransferase involved in cell wall biosynthesis
MAELVQHGKNGLLFNVGDADDLREKLRMFIENPDLVGELAKGIPAMKTIERDAGDFEERYASLLRRS